MFLKKPDYLLWDLKAKRLKKILSLASGYAYKIKLKDLLSCKILTFHSLTAACLFLKIDVHTLNKYIYKVTKAPEDTFEPLLGRYTLESLDESRLKINKSKELAQALLVTDFLSGGSYTSYSSISAFAYAIDAHPNNIREFLRRKKSSGKLSFYRGRYNIELANEINTTPSSLKIEIEVTDLETGIVNGYPTASIAAKALGINRKLIIDYFSSDKKKPLLGRYALKNVGDLEVKSLTISKTDSSLQVTNIETNEVFYFSSANEACRSLGLAKSSISRFLNGKTSRPIKKKYTIQ